MTAIRDLFTEHEEHLTDGMPDLVAVGYVNARRRDGRGERASVQLVVDANNAVRPIPKIRAEDVDPFPGPIGGGLFGGLFGRR